MTITDIKQQIIDVIQRKYSARKDEPGIESIIRSEVSSILDKNRRERQINTYSSVWVRKNNGVFRIKANVYPTFIGALIKFDFNVQL